MSLNIQSVNDAASKKDSVTLVGVAVHKNFTLETPPIDVYHDFFCCKYYLELCFVGYTLYTCSCIFLIFLHEKVKGYDF